MGHVGAIFDPVTVKWGHTRPSTASYGQLWPSVVGYRKLPQEIAMPDPSAARERAKRAQRAKRIDDATCSYEQQEAAPRSYEKQVTAR